MGRLPDVKPLKPRSELQSGFWRGEGFHVVNRSMSYATRCTRCEAGVSLSPDTLEATGWRSTEQGEPFCPLCIKDPPPKPSRTELKTLDFKGNVFLRCCRCNAPSEIANAYTLTLKGWAQAPGTCLPYCPGCIEPWEEPHGDNSKSGTHTQKSCVTDVERKSRFDAPGRFWLKPQKEVLGSDTDSNGAQMMFEQREHNPTIKMTGGAKDAVAYVHPRTPVQPVILVDDMEEPP